MMNNLFVSKGLILGIIVLFIGASFTPSTTGITEKQIVNSNFKTRGFIQELIDNASNGDWIFVPSGIYYENIVIYKSITLTGEDKDTTIIHGNLIESVIQVTADYVNINGFTIQNGDSYGIEMYSDYNIISDNIISNNKAAGIYLYSSYNNLITNNFITNNKIGILLEESFNNRITANNISLNYLYGIQLLQSKDNTISENNFINNTKSGYFKSVFWTGCWKNVWINNYWNQSRILPKFIFGTIYYRQTFNSYLPIPWFKIDWRPAQEPYDIT